MRISPASVSTSTWTKGVTMSDRPVREMTESEDALWQSIKKIERERDEAVKALRELDRLTAGCWDEGPPGAGWSSKELEQARGRAQEILAGPEEA